MNNKAAWNKGLTKETDARVRKYAKSLRGKNNSGSGENHFAWKGDEVGYFALHAWVIRKKGKARKCELCHTKGAKKYEWANKSQKYKRDLTDWIELCVSCHRKYDNKMNGRVVWNKGKKLGFTPKGAFKKGNIPWNKGRHTNYNKRNKYGQFTKQD